MTNAEANAVNTLLTWALGRRRYPDAHLGVAGAPTSERARDAAALLADKASRALAAGWTPERVRVVWPRQVDVLLTLADRLGYLVAPAGGREREGRGGCSECPGRCWVGSSG